MLRACGGARKSHDSTRVLLFLVRHGESTANAAGIWQGQADAPLSRRGRMQAEALASRLRALPFDRVISSDLSRARNTGALAMGRAPEADAAFREADVGAWEGLPGNAIAARFPEELAALMANRSDVRLGGGETLGEVWARVDGAIARLARELGDDGRAIVFSHGGVISGFLAGVLGARGAARSSLKLTRFANTGVSVLRIGAGTSLIHALNDVGHLGPSGVAEEERADRGGQVVRLEAHDDALDGAARAILEDVTPPRSVRAFPHEIHEVAARLLGTTHALAPLRHGSTAHALRDRRGLRLVDIGDPNFFLVETEQGEGEGRFR